MRRSAAFGIAAALVAGAALAQTKAPAGPPLAAGHSSSAPIDITAADTEVLQPNRLVVYRGNVEAIQEQTRMRSPELRATYRDREAGPKKKPANGASTQSSIEQIEALGPFYYVDAAHNQIAKSDHAIWVADTDIITLTGHVILTEDKDVTTGDKLVLNRSTGLHRLSMDTTADPNRRVRAIIFPNQTSAPPAKPAPPASAARPPAPRP